MKTQTQEKLYYIGIKFQYNNGHKDSTRFICRSPYDGLEIRNKSKNVILLTLEEAKKELPLCIEWFNQYKNSFFSTYDKKKYRRGAIFKNVRIYIGKAKKIKDKNFKIKIENVEISG